MNLDKAYHKYFLFCPASYIYANSFFRIKNKLEESQWTPYFNILEIIKHILTYSRNNVPAYKDKFKHLEVDKMKNLKDILDIPFTTKDEIKKNQLKFRSVEKFNFLTKKTTGGSTGQPLTIYKSREAMSAELAAMWRGYAWAGVDIGDKQARFWGVPFDFKDRMKAKLIDTVNNRIRLPAFSFNEQSLYDYFVKINNFKPVYFYGYVSMLYEFAKFIDQNNLQLNFKLKSVITTSEVLYDEQKKYLSRIFNAKVYNEYGCGEIGTIAHECEHGNLHYNIENIHIEILKDDKPCEDGEIGEIVVTELNNKAMPLIRYRLGDYGCFAKENCACGRALPTISKVYGRQYDKIITGDGRTYHGEFFMYIFEEIKRSNLGVGKFQVRQTAIDKYQIKIVPERGYSDKTGKLIIRRVKEHLGIDCMINIQLVDDIERENSGKMRLIVGLEG